MKGYNHQSVKEIQKGNVFSFTLKLKEHSYHFFYYND